jgi:NAD(P)-dependent dehydrogenase (short-subunit alcohol dehydrogenase family)
MTTTLITGANKGLGFETARRLVEAGQTVYLGSRDGPHQDAPLAYEELLHTFKEALNRALTGAVLPPVCATFDLTLTLSLLDIAHAARQGRQTQGPGCSRLWGVRGERGGDEDGARRSRVARQSKLVT